MVVREDDQYKAVYLLRDEGRCREAIDLIYDNENGTIRDSFVDDENHSWYVIGSIYFRMSEYKSAIEAFKRAIELWPEDADAYLGLANCYFECGDLGAVRDTLLEGSSRSPEDLRIRYNLANSYFDLAEYKKVMFLYKSVVEEPDPELREKSRKNIELTAKRLEDEQD